MKRITKKITLLFLLFSLTLFPIFGNGKQSSQIIPSGHWLYDDLTTLASEVKTTFYIETQPKTVGEIRLYINSIDFESLSKAGQAVYTRVNKYLDDEDNLLKSDYARVFLNLQLNPEFYYKTNKDIDWTFRTKFKDYAITFPIILGFSDFLTIESDPVVTASQIVMSEPDNFTNIPYAGNMIDFYLPKFAYVALAKNFDHWGMSFQLGREGMQFGQTNLDSVVYSRNFETDLYSQITLYNKYIKYALNVNQIEKDRYYYLHQLTLRPFKNFTVGCVEGSLLNAPFELRYLNPLMFMHQFASWYQYDDFPNPTTGEIYDYYEEGRFCAFLGFTVEYLPIKNLRIYGLYGQNEILDAGGSRSDEALSVPDSIAAQLGVSYDIPLENSAYLKTNVEAVYASPFYMVKQSPDWSLYRSRRNIQKHGNVKSWVGTPFGPDNFAVQAKVSYEPNDKWSVGANLLFSIKGENNYDTLFKPTNKTVKYYLGGKEIKPFVDEDGNLKVDKDGYLLNSDNSYYTLDENPSEHIHSSSVNSQWYWDYYPSVKYLNGKKEYKDIARNMWMSEVREYKGQIGINGHYKILENLDVSAQINYLFLINSQHKEKAFDQGFEFSVSVKYNLFK